MPLPVSSVSRERLHTRTIHCHGYRRCDGLWDIEAQLIDSKSYAFPNQFRGEIQPGEPLHELWIRLTLDEQLIVQAVAVATDAAPFILCPEVLPNFQRLRGLTIGPGWRAAVQQRLGGTQGCTHLVELLGPVATTALQTILAAKQHEAEQQGHVIQWHKKPAFLDTCHALACNGEVVRQHWPQFYQGEDETAA